MRRALAVVGTVVDTVTPEAVDAALRDGHQVVNIEYEGGVTASS